MGVVTISREFGAVSDDLGVKVAAELGYHFVDKEFIVALLDQYGMVGFAREYETRPGFWRSLSGEQAQQRREMVAMLNQVVQAVAHHGNVVIQGRSGFAILGAFADVLHVRLQAPLSTRIANISMSRAISYVEATAVVTKADEVRTAFVEGFYGVSWSAMHAFDLVINTAKVPAEEAINLVADAARTFMANLGPREPAIASIAVDPVLGEAVSREIGCSLLHR